MAEQRKCKHCGEVFEDEDPQQAQVQLLNHLKNCPEKPNAEASKGDTGGGRGQGNQADAVAESPQVERFRTTLTRVLGKNKSALVDNLCDVYGRNLSALASRSRFRSWIMRYGLTHDQISALEDSLFGLEDPSQSQEASGYQVIGQTRSGEPVIIVNPQSERDGREATPGVDQSYSAQSQQSNVVTQEQLSHEIARLHESMKQIVQEALQQGNQDQKKEQDTEERLRLATENARLAEQNQNLTAQLQELRSEVRDIKQNANQNNSSALEKKVESLESQLSQFTQGAQERTIEEVVNKALEPVAGRLSNLEQTYHSRAPSEGELRSQNLQTISKDIGENLQGLRSDLKQILAPALAQTLYNSLVGQGTSPQDALELTRTSLAHALGMAPEQTQQTSGNQGALKNRAEQFRAKYITTG